MKMNQLKENDVKTIVEQIVSTSTLKEGRVREIVDQTVRSAVRQQARDVEKHLANIHERLLKLER